MRARGKGQPGPHYVLQSADVAIAWLMSRTRQLGVLHGCKYIFQKTLCLITLSNMRACPWPCVSCTSSRGLLTPHGRWHEFVLAAVRGLACASWMCNRGGYWHILPFGVTGVPSVAGFTRFRSLWEQGPCMGSYIACLYRTRHRSLHRTTALRVTRCRSPRIVAVSCCCSPKRMPMSQSSVSVVH